MGWVLVIVCVLWVLVIMFVLWMLVSRMRSGATTTGTDVTAAGWRSFWLSNEMHLCPEYDEAVSNVVEGRPKATSDPIAWDLADLSSTMARTTSSLSRLRFLPSEESTYRMVALSSNLFHLIQKVSFSHYLVLSMKDKEVFSSTSAAKLSFQMEDVEVGGDKHEHTPRDSSNPALGSDGFLSSDRSTRLLFTWSAAAADAFVGDSVLPVGMTATQALM